MNYDFETFGVPSRRLLVMAVGVFDHNLAIKIASNHQRYFRSMLGYKYLC